MHNTNLLEKHCIKEAFPILDMLSVYTANTLFSMECPAGRDYTKTRNETFLELEKMFAPFEVNNKSINIILDSLHKKYLEASKEHLQILNKDNNYGIPSTRKSRSKHTTE